MGIDPKTGDVVEVIARCLLPVSNILKLFSPKYKKNTLIY